MTFFSSIKGKCSKIDWRSWVVGLTVIVPLAFWAGSRFIKFIELLPW